MVAVPAAVRLDSLKLRCQMEERVAKDQQRAEAAAAAGRDRDRPRLVRPRWPLQQLRCMMTLRSLLQLRLSRSRCAASEPEEAGATAEEEAGAHGGGRATAWKPQQQVSLIGSRTTPSSWRRTLLA